MTSSASLPEVLPHGSIEEVLPDVFFVRGMSRPRFYDMDWQFSRNMTIVRNEGELTLFNTVRLDDAGLEALERLGRVRNVVRLGAFHGRDDAFYAARFGAKTFALRGTADEHGLSHDALLDDGSALPTGDGTLLAIASSKMPEGVALLARAGGVLIACDSLQTWTGPDAFFDAASGERMHAAGFFGRVTVGVGYRAACEPSSADLRRIASLSFSHLFSAHGPPLHEGAREAVAKAIDAMAPDTGAA